MMDRRLYRHEWPLSPCTGKVEPGAWMVYTVLEVDRFLLPFGYNMLLGETYRELQIQQFRSV